MSYLSDMGLLSLGSQLKAISDQLYSMADEVYAALGIPLQSRWFPILRLLHDTGPTTVGEIAVAVGQTHSAISQLANKLTSIGFSNHFSEGATSAERGPVLAFPSHEVSLSDTSYVCKGAADTFHRNWRDRHERHCRDSAESGQRGERVGPAADDGDGGAGVAGGHGV